MLSFMFMYCVCYRYLSVNKDYQNSLSMSSFVQVHCLSFNLKKITVAIWWLRKSSRVEHAVLEKTEGSAKSHCKKTEQKLSAKKDADVTQVTKWCDTFSCRKKMYYRHMYIYIQNGDSLLSLMWLTVTVTQTFTFVGGITESKYRSTMVFVSCSRFFVSCSVNSPFSALADRSWIITWRLSVTTSNNISLFPISRMLIWQTVVPKHLTGKVNAVSTQLWTKPLLFKCFSYTHNFAGPTHDMGITRTGIIKRHNQRSSVSH